MENIDIKVMDRGVLAVACKFASGFYQLKSIDGSGIAELVPNRKGEKIRLTREKFNTAGQPIPQSMDEYILSNYHAFLAQLKVPSVPVMGRVA